LRAQADAGKDRDQQRELAVEAARILDIVDAVVRQVWDGKDSRVAAIPGFKLAWPVADSEVCLQARSSSVPRKSGQILREVRDSLERR
jgi:hypothetical protein